MRIAVRKRGFILIAVLVIVMLASMIAMSLLFRMRAEQASFSAAIGSEQGWHVAMSGIQQAMYVASRADEDLTWNNNPSVFRDQFVIDDGSDRWFFTIFSPPIPGEADVRYGMTDEPSKINVNVATAEMLQKGTWLSPEQVKEIAGSDPASGSSTNAAVSADPLLSFTSRPQFSTLDDLLRLSGFAPGVVYGEDANHNFHLDPNEDDGRLQFPPDDSDGQLFLGLREVATVVTYEKNVALDGSPRLQLNSTNSTVPAGLLPEKTAAYLELAWANKKMFKSPADLLEAKDKFKDPAGKEVEVESGVGAEELPIILDKLTTTFTPKIMGLINVNTASARVLQALPGITPEKSEEIVQARDGLRSELRLSPAWLYQEGLLKTNEFKAVAPLVTARSFQFRFNVIGYALPSGRFRVFEVIIDAADKQPKISYLRDITRYGLPFKLPATESESTNVPENS